MSGRVLLGVICAAFALPAAAHAGAFDPRGMTVGPDGAVWAVEPDRDGIARIATDGTFTSFPLPDGTAALGLATGPDGALRQDLSGRPTANAPRWTASLGADYRQSLGADLVMGLSARVRYASASSVSPFGQPLAVQPAHALVDAALRVSTRDERWQLALVGKNLTNRFVVTSVFDQSGTGSASGGVTGQPANQFALFLPPRTVMLELTGRF